MFCSGNRLPEFGRRVARLASFDRLRNRRLSAGDLRKVCERRQRSGTAHKRRARIHTS